MNQIFRSDDIDKKIEHLLDKQKEMPNLGPGKKTWDQAWSLARPGRGTAAPPDLAPHEYCYISQHWSRHALRIIEASYDRWRQ